MSGKNTKLISSIVLVLVVAALAIALGYTLPHKAPLPLSSENKVTTEEIDWDSFDYIAAPPTFGPIIHTQEATVVFGTDKATTILVNEQAEKISTQQDVILSDTESYILPLGGNVENMTDNKDGTTTIDITLPEGTNTELLSPRVEIITLETIASKRVPLSALQKDESEQNFVWIVEPEKEHDPSSIRRQYIEIGLTDEEYFVELGDKIDTFTPVIINPDKKLRSDKRYKIATTEIQGSIHNPIRQAWINFELGRMENERSLLQQKIDDCEQGVRPLNYVEGAQTLSDGTTSSPSACGSSANAATDPMQIFNSILQKGNGSSGCATSANCNQ